MADLELSITVGESAFNATGESAVVMKALAEFKSLLEAGPKPRRQAASPKETEQDGGTGGGDGGSAKGKPLGSFVNRTWPNQSAKATAIILWARENEAKTSLTPAEVLTQWRKTTGKTPANATQVLQTAEKQGWVHNEGKGHYSVTGHGEAMVSSTK